MNQFILGPFVDICLASVRQRILFWVICLRGIRLPLFQNISHVSMINLFDFLLMLNSFFTFIPVLLFSILLFRYESGDTRLTSTTLINEMLILTFLVLVESIRLVLGQKHQLVSFMISQN